MFTDIVQYLVDMLMNRVEKEMSRERNDKKLSFQNDHPK